MMRTSKVAGLMAVVLAMSISTSSGHFHVLMPQKVNVQPRGTAQVTYWVGHPFEHILTDATKPAKFFAISPEGQRQNLLPDLDKAKMEGQEGKEFVTWQATVKTPERGDYIIGLISQPVLEERTAHQSIVKTVLHARVQKGWDRAANLPAEFVPLTRPYGLRPNMIFQVQLLKAGKPVPGVAVEIEMYNEQPVPEKRMPPEEQITHVVKTDPNGVATFSLPQAGWWGMAAEVPTDKTQAEGNSLPTVYHTTYWVLVEAPGERPER